jgi:hypothetical protein
MSMKLSYALLLSEHNAPDEYAPEAMAKRLKGYFPHPPEAPIAQG